MKKGFKALDIIYNNIDYLTSDVVIENEEVNSCLATIQEQLPTIKQALLELKAIKEAKLSNALEALKIIMSNVVLKEDENPYYIKEFDMIEQALLKAQELEKMLAVLKEAKPNEALEGLKTPLHNEWLRYYPQIKELNESTKITDGCRMIGSDADNYLVVKQALLKAQELEKENKRMKDVLLELADLSPDNRDCVYQCSSIIRTILDANISPDINKACKEGLEDLKDR